MRLVAVFLAMLLPLVGCFGESAYILRDNIVKATPGDYIVTSQGKMCTVLHIRDRTLYGLVVEEITVPLNRIPKVKHSWRKWVESGASGHTAWVSFNLNVVNGNIDNAYSYTKNMWFQIPQSDNFFSQLLNLEFEHVPYGERKRVGPRTSVPTANEWKNLWQPRMIVDGQTVGNVKFEAWRALWPNDGGDLAGKLIEVYIPDDSERYPSYFPYWLQISGAVCKAKVRIVDSGTGLVSPKPNLKDVARREIGK